MVSLTVGGTELGIEDTSIIAQQVDRRHRLERESV
jgi:hypothetical protein